MNIIEEIFKVLFDKYGPQYWWPGDSPFEIIIGAILTQSTNWNNVERAIKNLKENNLLDPIKIFNLSIKDLEELIKPCGFYRVKAKRIMNFLNFLFDNYNGDLKTMNNEPTGILRRKLLNISGLGNETVDSILLYSFQRPVFVIDKYTKIIGSCLKIGEYSLTYFEWQKIFQDSLFPIYQIFNEYHALLVTHGKKYCRKCKGSCFLRELFYLKKPQFSHLEYPQLKDMSNYQLST